MEDTKNINSNKQDVTEEFPQSADETQISPIKTEPTELEAQEIQPVTTEKLENEIQDLISNIISLMGIKVMVRTKFTEESYYYANLRTRNADGLLIGRRGLTIQSIQAVVNQIMKHRYPDMLIDVFVDVSGYRKRRENFLKKKALAVAKIVVDTKREMALDILTEKEFRMIEHELAPLGTVRVYTVGSGSRRTVVIAPL